MPEALARGEEGGDSPLKILLVSDYSTPDGGTELHVLQLRSALRAAGHDARLLASATGAESERTADFECWGTRARVPNRMLQTYNPFAVAALRRVLRDFRPDVVHLNMFLTQLSPALLRLLGAVPTVYTAHLYRAICPKGTKLLPDGSTCAQDSGRACLTNGCLPGPLWMLDMGQRALLRRYVKHIDMVLANSEYMRQELERTGIESRHQPLLVDLPQPAPWSSEGRPAVAFVGRLTQIKGVSVLLRAVARVRVKCGDVRLLIAGDGPAAAELGSLARDLDLGEAVEFLGRVPEGSVGEVYGRAHVVAVPSVWPEPLGLVALEAAAAGRPVVASMVGGLPETVLDGRTGFLVKPGSVKQLADRISELLHDQELAAAMGKAAAAHVQSTVNNERRLQAHVAAYREAVSGRATLRSEGVRVR